MLYNDKSFNTERYKLGNFTIRKEVNLNYL